MKNIGQMIKQAQEIQQRMNEMQEGLNDMEVEGASGGGMVKVLMTGKANVKKVTIDPSLMGDDKTMLEDLVVAAFQDAKVKIEDHIAGEMEKITGGLQLPPGMQLPF